MIGLKNDALDGRWRGRADLSPKPSILVENNPNGKKSTLERDGNLFQYLANLQLSYNTSFDYFEKMARGRESRYIWMSLSWDTMVHPRGLPASRSQRSIVPGIIVVNVDVDVGVDMDDWDESCQ